jgi:hypothetical protein
MYSYIGAYFICARVIGAYSTALGGIGEILYILLTKLLVYGHNNAHRSGGKIANHPFVAVFAHYRNSFSFVAQLDKATAQAVKGITQFGIAYFSVCIFALFYNKSIAFGKKCGGAVNDFAKIIKSSFIV